MNKTPTVEIHRVAKVNMPELFVRDDFRAYLNDSNNRMATWHMNGDEPNEYSDVFVNYDHGEGSHSDMPGWELVVAAMDAAGFEHGIVQITNLEE